MTTVQRKPPPKARLTASMAEMLKEHANHPDRFKGGKKQAMAIAYSKARRRKT